MTHSLAVGLGQLALVSTTTGMSLNLSSELSISSRSELGPPQPTIGILTTETLHQSFVQRADGFRFVVDVQFGFELDPTLRVDILEKLGSAIEKAPLWNELRLFPQSIKVSASKSSAGHQITICMSYADISTHAFQKVRHKLKIVYLNMHITHGRLNKRPKHYRCPSTSSVLSLDDHSTLQPLTHSYEVEPLNILRISTPHCSSRPNALGGKIYGENRYQDDQSDDPTPSCPPKVLAKVPSLFSSQGERDCNRWLWTPDATICLPKRARTSTGPLSPEANMVETPELVQLLATGFREAISDLPRRRLDSIHTNGSDDFLRLSTIAPALFVPGYLSNVTSRTVFLPLLSHALLNVGFKNAHSASLRSKVSQLLNVGSTTNWAAQNENSDQETLASKLFGLVQRGVLDLKASRRLEPIITSPTRSSSCGDACMTSILESTLDGPSSQDSSLLNDSFDDADALDDLDILSVLEERDGAPLDEQFAPPCISSQEAVVNDDDADADDSFNSMRILEPDLDPREPFASAMASGFSDDDHEQDDLLAIPDGLVCFPPQPPPPPSGLRASLPDSSISIRTPVLEPCFPGTGMDMWTTTEYDEAFEEMLL